MKALLIHILVLILVFAIGCGQRLRPDPEMLSAITANYPTAEFRACGNLWHGLGICVLEEGDSLENLSFAIQGYYEGTVRIDSGDCEVAASYNYLDNGFIKNVLRGTIHRSCVITFTVSPEYPREEKTGIVTSGFRGHLRIKMVPKGSYSKVGVFRIPQTFKKTWTLGVGETDPVDVYFEGCGVSFHRQFTPNQSKQINLQLADLFSGEPRTCVLEGVVRSKKYKDLLLSAIVSVYYDNFNPLPLPVTTFKSKHLEIDGDEAVSVVSVGSEFILNNKHKFKIDKKEIVRLLTSKGRSVIGVVNPDTGEIQWVLR